MGSMLRTLIVVALFSCTMAEGNLHALQDSIASLLRMRTYTPMPDRAMRQILQDIDPVPDFFADLRDGAILCRFCRFLVAGLQRGTTPITTVGSALCRIYIALATGTFTTFCDDIIAAHVPIFKFIIENSRILDPEYACSVLLQNRRCYYDKAPLRWTVQVPRESQKVVPETRPDQSRSLKVLHLTDVHLQPDYVVGSVRDCGLPLCCKSEIKSARQGRGAGRWGDHQCDVPMETFRETLRHVRAEHGDIDLIYFTGDVVDHTSWRESRKKNGEVLEDVYGAFGEFFPGVRTLPVIGNHESAPLNVFPPSDPGIESAGLSSDWLYDVLGRLWSPWLPPDSIRTVKRQGYYSIDINPRFKVIALNNNVCYTFNWWLLYDTDFLREQLEFLSDQLRDSESRGQFVHILAHVPVGNKECIEPWERSYGALIERFSHLIKGQFFGHTHTDELKVFYSTNGSAPVNVAFNGASLTPYKEYNMNYKIILVDPSNYDVSDVETYTFNLTRANEAGNTPEWFRLYSTRQAYNLDDLGPVSIHRLAERLIGDRELFDTYWRFYVREGDPSLRRGCDDRCRRRVLCEIFATESIKADC